MKIIQPLCTIRTRKSGLLDFELRDRMNSYYAMNYMKAKAVTICALMFIGAAFAPCCWAKVPDRSHFQSNAIHFNRKPQGTPDVLNTDYAKKVLCDY